jgi:phosphate transport system substrate-binding protein
MKKKGDFIMKKRILKIVISIICISLMTVMTACKSQSDKGDDSDVNTDAVNNNSETNEGSDNVTKEAEKMSGTLRMAGSTSMEKLANALAEAFMNKYPEVTISPEFIGSSAGIEALMSKTVDIGNASRSLKDSEKSTGITENIVAIDGIAIVVDKKNTIKDLTKQQLFDIYTGSISNWSEIGGSDQPIVVIGRESGSGTRSAFEEILEVEDKCKYANELSSTGAVMAKAASTKGSIGYVSLDIVDDTVTAVSLEGAQPTEESIKSGDYFLSRPFVMATMGDISEQSDLVQTFFEFLFSDEGTNIVKEAGLIVPDK